MKTTLTLTAFVTGFATGWITRSTLDSAKPATLQVVAFVMDTSRRVQRAFAIERERVEDFVAEAREQADRRRADRVAGADRTADRAARRDARADGRDQAEESAGRSGVDPVVNAA